MLQKNRVPEALRTLFSTLFFLSCVSAAAQSATTSDVQVQELPNVLLQSVSVRQQRICYSSTVCVDVLIEHPWVNDGNYLEMGGAERYLRVYKGNNKMSQAARVVKVPSDYFENPQTNCHGYSLLMTGMTGLPSHVWVDDPQPLLREFYSLVHAGPVSELSSKDLQKTGLHSRDVIVLYDSTLGGMAIHSGIFFMDDKTKTYWIRSKFGEIDVFDVPAKDILISYRYADSYRIYRHK